MITTTSRKLIYSQNKQDITRLMASACFILLPLESNLWIFPGLILWLFWAKAGIASAAFIGLWSNTGGVTPRFWEGEERASVGLQNLESIFETHQRQAQRVKLCWNMQYVFAAVWLSTIASVNFCLFLPATFSQLSVNMGFLQPWLFREIGNLCL